MIFYLFFQVDEALAIKNTDIAKELSLPPVKLHCSSKIYAHFIVLWFKLLHVQLTRCVAASVLAEDAIKAALADYRLKQHDNHQEAVGASN